jgi:short-subunit dehydrogenase
MPKQTVLVTGASSGIGSLIANKLHDSGYQVFGTSRYPDKYRGRVPFELLPLDITSSQSVQDCIDLLMTRIAVLDVLINNAGAFLGGSVEETTIEQAHKHFETNFWGAVKMTRAVLPIMRRERSGKIIATGSLVGLVGVPFSSYYSATKHALEGFFKSLRLEVKNFNIQVSVIEPAFFKTNIDSVSEHAAATIEEYDETRKRANDFVRNSVAAAPTPEPVADTVLKIIRTKNPKYSYPIGKNSRFLPTLQFLAPGVFERGFLKAMKL